MHVTIFRYDVTGGSLVLTYIYLINSTIQHNIIQYNTKLYITIQYKEFTNWDPERSLLDLSKSVSQETWFYDGTAVRVCTTKVDQTWQKAFIVAKFFVFFALPFSLFFQDL